MALFENLNTDFEHTDNRGRLIQLIHDGFRQVNVLETKGTYSLILFGNFLRLIK